MLRPERPELVGEGQGGAGPVNPGEELLIAD